MLIDEALEVLGMERPVRPKNKIECPHHEEKTPSLHLYDDDFYCYSCGANGDGFGLIAQMQGRPIEDVLKEYGDGNYETSRTRRASRQQQIKDLWHSWYAWLDHYMQKFYETLDDLPRPIVMRKIDEVFAPVDDMRSLLPHEQELEPHELESHLRKATAYLNDRLQIEIDLRNEMRVDAGVSRVTDELPQPELLNSIPQAGRRGRSSVRGGSTPRQYGRVRVEAT